MMIMVMECKDPTLVPENTHFTLFKTKNTIYLRTKVKQGELRTLAKHTSI